jgi:DNA polymerase type B, organellar and viral.
MFDIEAGFQLPDRTDVLSVTEHANKSGGFLCAFSAAERAKSSDRSVGSGPSEDGFSAEQPGSQAGRQPDWSPELSAHVESLWQALPDQSRKRLECLAVSTGVGVSVEDHRILCGALAMIAEEEGTLEREAEFARIYLGTRAHVEKVARRVTGRESEDFARKRQKSKEASEARLERTRDQMAIALDGEGVTLEDGSHVYRYMAACTSDGEVLGELDVWSGITTRQALDFIAGLPKHDPEGRPYLGVFGYGLGYDQCKWLEGLSNRELFELFHAEDLQAKAKCGPYRLNLLGKCLQITNRKAEPGYKRTLVWDILKAFQAAFVSALRTWKVGSEEEWARIEAMKKQRGDFVNTDWEAVKAYCRDECRLLAALVEKYVQAHCDAGIDLRGKYHGAGSTGDAFLSLMDAEDKRTTYEFRDEDLLKYRSARSAFSRAFFGGRAEVSRLGVIKGPVYSWDIGSAYPHALFSMPCVKHGKWKHVTDKIGKVARASRMAVVHYQIERQPKTESDHHDEAVAKRTIVMDVMGGPSEMAWGALPYRTSKGSIVFPTSHPGGWAWWPEYDAAKENWPGIVPLDAWCLQSDCSCGRPFRAIGDYYLRRLEWGKEGPGIVLKLGLNSCYGKYAQVIGRNPKYSCRIVAGYITATTRGRILQAIASAKDPWSVVYVATDGIITDELIAPPDPVDNETKEGASKRGKVMLGAWETPHTNKDCTHPDDHFILQPGFYFSTKPKGKAKTRGMPLEIVDQERGRILDQWRREPLEPPRGLPKRPVFRGVKTSILPPTKTDSRYRRKESYGRWEQEDRDLKYVINPKRSHPVRLTDLRKGPNPDPAYRLLTWWLLLNQEESAEYAKDKGHDEARASLDEQPDFVETPGTNVGD